MNQPSVQLAIETSSSQGSVTLGSDGSILETVILTRQRRHAMELLPTIDNLFKKYNYPRQALDAVYVSIGPGSFTGLRIAITTAKTIAYLLNAKAVAVPTLNVIIQNLPLTQNPQQAAVMLNAKRGQCFTQLYDANPTSNHWIPRDQPQLLTPQQVCQAFTGDFEVVGDHLPDYNWPNRANLLPETLATPKSDVVWAIGRKMELANQITPAIMLNPLYVRLPEAEEVWQAKHSV